MEKSKIEWKSQDGETLNMKYPLFLDNELVLMTASGPRGPARVGGDSSSKQVMVILWHDITSVSSVTSPGQSIVST